MPNLNITESRYWLATDSVKIAHFGYADVGNNITTGQPELLTFPTMAALVSALMSRNFPVISGSTYPEQEWYLWDNKAVADAALTAINSNSTFPVLVPDIATGERTVSITAWCSATRVTSDGRWGFPRIPSDLMDEWNISMEDRTAWLTVFKPTIVIDPTI